MKFITADDYGMSKEINRAITELCDKNIVSKVSVMAVSSGDLLDHEIAEHVEIGLHVQLTGKSNLTGINLQQDITPLKLIYMTLSNKLKKDMIIDVIEHQYHILTEKGFKIDYMDTHQHIHIIPGVLDALITCAKKTGINSIRCLTIEKKYMLFYLSSLMRCGFVWQIPKMVLLYAMGGLMKRKLDEENVDYCRNLFLMPLATGGRYEDLLKAILNKIRTDNINAEVVVHPGYKSETPQGDAYSDGRFIEYQALINQGASVT